MLTREVSPERFVGDTSTSPDPAEQGDLAERAYRIVVSIKFSSPPTSLISSALRAQLRHLCMYCTGRATKLLRQGNDPICSISARASF